MVPRFVAVHPKSGLCHFRLSPFDFVAFYLARIAGAERLWQPDLMKHEQAIATCA
jgi:hypothetical protein